MKAQARIYVIEHAAALLDGVALLMRSGAAPASLADVAPAAEFLLTAHQLYNLSDELRQAAGIAPTPLTHDEDLAA